MQEVLNGQCLFLTSFVKSFTMRQLVLSIVLLLCQTAFGTHNYSGFIGYELVDAQQRTFRIWVEVCAHGNSHSLRDSLLVTVREVGSPAQLANVPLYLDSSGPLPHAPEVAFLRYSNTYSFPAYGHYALECSDPNRVENILNMPSSVNIAMSLHAYLYVDSDLMTGGFSSPTATAPTYIYAMIGVPFHHTPGFADAEGDSVVVSQKVPSFGYNQAVLSYTAPSDPMFAGVGNPMLYQVDTNGDFTWDFPELMGRFNVAFEIAEHRNGIMIGSVWREVHIVVSDKVLDVPSVSIQKPSVYPVPATDRIFITSLDKATQLTLTDITGRILMAEVPLPGNEGISVAFLSPGIYHLQVRYHDGSDEVLRFVKL